MIKSLEITADQWNTLHNSIKKEYPPSVYLIRGKMREKLGFVQRTHSFYENGYTTRKILLDFYSEKKRTFFLMKYSDVING